MRLLRSMIVTGLTFAIGVGLVAAVIGLPIWLFGGVSLNNMLGAVARLSIVSCLIGFAFSGLVAVTARGRSFDKLSLPYFTGMGAGVGFLYFLFMGFSGAFSVWSTRAMISNLLLVTLTGGASAAGLLLIARKGRKEIGAGEAQRRIGDG
ncbi:MAG TPA: hypothetical protein VMJ30_03460 [Gemmatimonadales bacterium]|nr:hypothetical protein [Gemmatimonadales bacterium]